MTRSISVFALTTAATFLALAPGQAHGFRRTQSAFACAPFNSDDHWGAYAISNNALAGTKVYACGVDNDSEHHLRNVVATNPIAVSGSAYMSEGIRAQACLAYSASLGGACGGWTANAPIGAVTLYPSASAWAAASPTDSPYLIFYLSACRSNGTGVCSAWNLIRGYRVDYN